MSQSITPELRRWILDQVAAGHSPEAVLQAMATAGWQEDVALAALETTLTGYLAEQGVNTPTGNGNGNGNGDGSGNDTTATADVNRASNTSTKIRTTAEPHAPTTSLPEFGSAQALDEGLGSAGTADVQGDGVGEGGRTQAQGQSARDVESVAGAASVAGQPQTAAQRWAQRLTRPAADASAGAGEGAGTGTLAGRSPATSAATGAALGSGSGSGPGSGSGSGSGPAAVAASRPTKPQPKPMPGPDLSGSPRVLDLGDRQVGLVVAMAKPRVVVFSQFLSDQECDALVALAAPRMARSLTVENETGGEAINPDRTSQGMFFRRAETELVARIETRIARLLRWPLENGEGLQVLHYQVGAEYKPHYDYFDPSQPGTPTILKRGGQRVGTLVMYLNNPERGGGTTFPDVGLEVLPQRGHAVFFSYDSPHPSTQTLHGGAPVLAGEKWVATKWLREAEFI